MVAEVKILVNGGEVPDVAMDEIRTRLGDLSRRHVALRELTLTLDVGSPSSQRADLAVLVGGLSKDDFQVSGTASNTLEAVDTAIRSVSQRLVAAKDERQREQNQSTGRDWSRHRSAALVGVLVVMALAAIAAVFRSDHDGGPEQYRIAGKVTLDGAPVPAGTIYFEPDPAKGNTGRQVFTDIKNGQYVTQAGRGCIPGAVLAIINAWDGEAVGDYLLGSPLHEPVTIPFEMPSEDTTRDFELADLAP